MQEKMKFPGKKSIGRDMQDFAVALCSIGLDMARAWWFRSN